MYQTICRRRTLILLGLLPMAGHGALAQDGSVSVVQNFANQVIRIGQSPSARERFTRFLPLIRQSFDISGMIRVAIGTHWNSVSGAERGVLEREFANFVAANHANRINNTEGTRVVVSPVPERGGQRLARAEFIEASGARTSVSYALRGSRIVDIYLDGNISELAARRAEFSSVISSSGANGLIALLRQRTARFLGEA